MVINTLRLQSELYNFHAICKEAEGEAFFLTSALVTTCLSQRSSSHVVKIHGKSRSEYLNG